MPKWYKRCEYLSHHGAESLDIPSLWKCSVPNETVGLGLGMASDVLFLGPEADLALILGRAGKSISLKFLLPMSKFFASVTSFVFRM